MKDMIGQLARYGEASSGVGADLYDPLSCARRARASGRMGGGRGSAGIPGGGEFRLCRAQRMELPGPWRKRAGRRRQFKFLLVQGGGMALNAAFTWIVTSPMDQPNWVTLIPCGLVSPLLTYWLQRRWVFG